MPEADDDAAPPAAAAAAAAAASGSSSSSASASKRGMSALRKAAKAVAAASSARSGTQIDSEGADLTTLASARYPVAPPICYKLLAATGLRRFWRTQHKTNRSARKSR